MQLHTWQDEWLLDARLLYGLDEMRRQGLLKAIGLSLNRWEPSNGIGAVKTGLIDSVQVIYSIFDQSPEDELFPVCQELNVGVIVRVALDEGSLGGKMTKDTKFPASDWRSRYFSSENLANTLERVDKLKHILPRGMSLPQMALRFVLSHPAVSTTIVGMRKLEHFRENVALSDQGPLPPDLLRELTRHRWDRKPTPSSD
jgi:aryl-alcohol dehydrogenase-like predicted oxidoreductase